MSARGRVLLIVALVALVASGAVVAGVLATRSGVPSVKPLKGQPTLALDLGVRTDPEARALRRASQLYNAGQAKQAGEIFGRYDSLDAEVGAALADWPAGTVERLRTLAATHPHSSLAALNLGVALYWSRQGAAPPLARRAAARAQPDTHYPRPAADPPPPRFAPRA